MKPQRSGYTRRAALTLAGVGGLSAAGLGGRASAQAPPFAPHEADIPINGRAGPGLESLDKAMVQIMERHGIPGAALAIARKGKLVYAKGFGWGNTASGEPVKPDSLFGLASLSKPITAVAVLKLVEDGRLDLDAKVFDVLKGIRPPKGARTDPRLREITVRHCLYHAGGWDRMVNGDPINWEPQICRALRLKPPVSPAQFVSFVQALPLDFKPGSDAKYSNVGYIILGEVVARASGLLYERYVIDNVLKPIGITRGQLHPRTGKYLAGEAQRHLPGSLHALPPMRLPMVDAAGGWTCSAVDMVRFLSNLDGTRGKPVLKDATRRAMVAPPPEPIKPHPDGTWFGLGWDRVAVKDNQAAAFKDGSYQGIRTFMKHLPGGVNWALLYNASMEFDPIDMQIGSSAIRDVRQAVDAVEKYPDVDLFDEYPR